MFDLTIDQIGLICFAVMSLICAGYWVIRGLLWTLTYMIQRYRLLGED